MKFNISIGYRQCPLYENVSIEIKEGTIVHIIGENGSGKSTFYKTLLGEVPPLSGEVPNKIINSIAIISDYISLPNELLVKDLLVFIGKEKRQNMKEHYGKLFDVVSHFTNQQIKSLSSGQRRILEI